MPNVEIPNVGVVQFPDDMTPEQISGVIRKKFPNLTPPEAQREEGVFGDLFRKEILPPKKPSVVGAFTDPFASAWKAWAEPPYGGPLGGPASAGLAALETGFLPFTLAGSIAEHATEQYLNPPGTKGFSTPVSRTVREIATMGAPVSRGVSLLRRLGRRPTPPPPSVVAPTVVPRAAEQLELPLTRTGAVRPSYVAETETLFHPLQTWTGGGVFEPRTYPIGPGGQLSLGLTRDVPLTPGLAIAERARIAVETENAVAVEKLLKKVHRGGKEPPALSPRVGPTTPLGTPSGPVVAAEELGWFGRIYEAGRELPGIRHGRAAVGWFITPIISRLEGMGPEGRVIARLYQRVQREALTWYGDYIDPLVRQAQKLSPFEKENFLAVAEQGAAAVSPKVAKLHEDYLRVFGTEGEVVGRARELGIHIEPRELFFPHEFTPEFRHRLIQDKLFHSKVIERLINSGKFTNRQDALRYLQDMLGHPTIYRERLTAAEFARLADFPEYIKDPAEAIFHRGVRLSERFAERAVFGEEREILRAIISKVAETNPQKAQQIEALLKYAIKGGEYDPLVELLGPVARTLTTVQAVTKLPTASVMNLSQPTLLLFLTGIGNLTRATIATAVKGTAAKEEARRLGLFADMAIRRWGTELGAHSPTWAGKAGEKVTKASLGIFNWSEVIVRSVVAQAGLDWAKVIQRRLSTLEQMSPKEFSVFKRELQNLLFNDKEISQLLVSRQLSPDNIRQVAWALADQVIFFPSRARRSQFYYESPMGPVVLQFKNFIMGATRLFRQAIIDEARQGNWRPMSKLLYALPTMAVTGEAFRDFQSAILGRRRPAPGTDAALLWRAFDNISSVGGLGVGFDFISRATSVGGLARWAVGPTGGDVGDLFFRGGQIAKAMGEGDPSETARQGYELGRWGVSRLPAGIGPSLVQTLPESVPKSPFPDETVLDRLGWSERARQRAHTQALTRRYLSEGRWRQLMREFGGD